MIQVFQVFKLVMGIMISVFVLYFLVNYAGSYATVQEEMRLGKIMQNFDKGVRDVYTTGNPASYDGFAKAKDEISFDVAKPPGIVTKLGKQSLSVPAFFKVDEDLLLGRGDLDFGWYKFTYVLAVPETIVIFNPMSADADSVIQDIVESTPSTMGFEPKISFGYCDGDEIISDFCGDGTEPCEKELFLKDLKTRSTSMRKCSARIGPNRKLVTVSDMCSGFFASTGVCVKLPDSQGIGNAYLVGVGEYVYHDPLDIIVLLVGGYERDPIDVFGIWGDNMYHYKNVVFAEEVGRIANITAQTSILVASAMASEFDAGYINELSDYYGCIPVYLDLSDALAGISEILSDEEYYTDTIKLGQLYELQVTAGSHYNTLVSKGCEYVI